MTSLPLPDVELSPHDWSEVNRILEAIVPGYEVWVFGSRATRTAKPYSDLDLAIITDQRLPLATMADLTVAFDESDLAIKVDVVDWAATSEAFREIIHRTAVVVRKSAGRAFSP
jgi:type I restriction enzyme S subunit